MLVSISSTGLASGAGSGRLFPPLVGSGGLRKGTRTMLLDVDWAVGLLGAGSLEVFLNLLRVGPSSSSTAFLLASASFCLELVVPLFLPLAAFFGAC